MTGAKVACRTANPDRSGATNIAEWRFDLIRDSIRNVLEDAEIAFADLPDAGRLSKTDLKRVGSARGNVTTVKLEMEARGEITRVPGAGPQCRRLAGG